MSADEAADQQQDATQQGITEIAVQGFKSLYDEQRIQVRPLTILAGANNSGKSSIMQPLLMMKQTLEVAAYDPGPLHIREPNVHFTSAEQFLSWRRSGRGVPIHLDGAKFTVRLSVRDDETRREEWMKSTFQYREGRGIDIFKVCTSRWPHFPLRPEMELTGDDISEEVRRSVQERIAGMLLTGERVDRIETLRKRCFLTIRASSGDMGAWDGRLYSPFEHCVALVIHVPALRDNPRAYPKVSSDFQHRLQYEGVFNHYVASIIESWQDAQGIRIKEPTEAPAIAFIQRECSRRLKGLGRALEMLGLTWTVEARRLNDVEIELRAARLPKGQEGGAYDLVNVADMGVGVSQVLPAVVALLTAVKGQLVYLEHPERDLHPRAQVALAKLLADAAMRGVRVVVETHSSLLLLGVQTLVAEGKLPPDRVALHWFKRGDDGATTVTSADLDEAGAFGDWPEDFADVDLKSQSRYLDAAELVLWKQARAGK